MADNKITGLDPIDAVDVTDIIPIVDVSDTTQSPQGSTKHSTVAQILERATSAANPAVQNTYRTVAVMIANQSFQTAGFLQYVADASLDPNITSGPAYYEYLGTTDEDLGDYRLLSSTEAETIVNTPPINRFTVGSISTTESSVLIGNTVGVHYEDSGDTVVGIIFPATFSNYIDNMSALDSGTANFGLAIFNITQNLWIGGLDVSFSYLDDIAYKVTLPADTTDIADIQVNDVIDVFITPYTSDQDNIPIVKGFEADSSAFLDLVAGIDALPKYTVTEKQIVFFQTSIIDPDDVLNTAIITLAMRDKGKGTYGVGGDSLLGNLWIVGTRRLAYGDAEIQPNTQVINLGSHTSTTVEAVFNAQAEFTVQAKTDGLRLVNITIDSVEKQYFFTGVGGDYGTGGDLTATADQFSAITGDEPIFVGGSGTFPYIIATDEGVLNDGSDQTTELANLISNAPTGSTILFPNGTYATDSAIIIDKKLTLLFEPSALLKVFTVDNELGLHNGVITVTANDVKIYGATIDGNYAVREEGGGVNRNAGIYVEYTANNTVIENLTAYNCPRQGLCVLGNSGFYKNIHVYDTSRHNISVGDGGNIANVTDSNTFINITCEGGVSDAAFEVNDGANNTYISNFVFDGTFGQSPLRIVTHDRADETNRNTVFENGRINSNVGCVLIDSVSETNENNGVYLKNISMVGDDDAILLDSLSKNIYLENLKIETTGIGILISGTCDNFNLKDSIIDSGGVGLSITENSNRIIIEGSKIESDSNGITMIDTPDNIYLENLKIQATSIGVLISGTSDNVNLKDSIIDSGGVGISINETSDCVILKSSKIDSDSIGVLISGTSDNVNLDCLDIKSVNFGVSINDTSQNIHLTKLSIETTETKISIVDEAKDIYIDNIRIVNYTDEDIISATGVNGTPFINVNVSDISFDNAFSSGKPYYTFEYIDKLSIKNLEVKPTSAITGINTITVRDSNDVIIDGIEVNNMRRGLRVFDSNNVVIQNIKISNSTDEAIFIDTANNLIIKNAKLSEATKGIIVTDSINITVRDSEIKENTGVAGADFNTVEMLSIYNSIFHTNDENGLRTLGCNNVKIANNTFYNNNISETVGSGWNLRTNNDDIINYTVLGNNFYDDQSPQTQDYSIDYTEGTGSIDRVIIKNNLMLLGFGGDSITPSSTIIVSDNI